MVFHYRSTLSSYHSMNTLPIEILLEIALSLRTSSNNDAEHLFTALSQAIPAFGRWTLGRAADIQRAFGYNVNITPQAIKWTRYGLLHRNNGPAIVYTRGLQEWYQCGRLHRRHGPAKVFPDGTTMWYHNGRLHGGSMPAIIWADGAREWYSNGLRHRERGPATILVNGTREYYHRGKLHCDNGPAVIRIHGRQEYWRHGRQIRAQYLIKN